MTPPDGLLAAVRADPNSDGPRLIYADYLSEQGDPRAEFIRAQLALAQLDEFDPRRPELVRVEADLLTLHGDDWAAPFRGLATGPVFRRGFVEEVKVTARQFLARPAELLGAGAVSHLHILDASSHFAAVLASPQLAGLRGLTVYAQYLREPLARAVAESPHLGNLATLHLGRNHVGAGGAERLAGGTGLGGLTDLDLSDNELSDGAAQLLARSGRFGGVARLNLAGNALTPVGAAALVRGGPLPVLGELGLAHNRLGGHAAPAPPGFGELLHLRKLDLSHNALTADDLARLLPAERPGAPRAADLDLSFNRLEDAGIERLVRTSVWPNLRRLRLGGNAVTDAGLIALARASNFQHLRHLDLSNNLLSDEGFRALLDSRGFPRLTRLVYPGYGLTLRLRLALERRFG